MFNSWWIFIILYLILYVVFTQFFKVALRKSKDDGALIVLVQMLSGLIVLVFMPFFGITFPSDIKVYLFLGIACIFYAITDRANTTARRGLEVSVYSVLGQLSAVFMIAWGIIFFKEAVVLKKIIGAILILAGNVLVLYKKGKFQWNKYVLFSIIGNLAMSIGISIDVGISDQFNLPIYVAITLIVPAIFITLAGRIRPKAVINEFKKGDKKAIMVLGCSWGAMLVSMLRAYQLGEVTTVAPLCAVTTIINVFVAYFALKEKDSLPRKLLAAAIVVAGIVLMKI